jgi:hypothetical protein
VTLRALSGTAQFFGSGIGVLRYENVRTAPDGKFRFGSSLELKAATPLTSIEGYWLTANVAYRSVQQINAGQRDHRENIDTASPDISWSISSDPLFRSVREGAHRVNLTSYFPVAIQFNRPCQQNWNANCIRLENTSKVRIPLIPALNDPGLCRKIADPALSEQCRQLNTYRAAFLHVETVAQVRADKQLCAQVDRGHGSEACLKALEIYIANPQLYAGRLPFAMETEPDDKVLILTPIAGMTAHRHQHGQFNPFYETGYYTACYTIVQRPPEDAVCATVSLAPSEQAKNWTRARVFAADGYTKGAEQTEIVGGQPVTVVDLPHFYIAFWISGSKAVTIIAYRPRRVEATPAARTELIRRYVLKYRPSPGDSN